MPTVSAIIITKNEERNLTDCLVRLTFCDEIIVLDNGSTDQTVTLAKKNGAKIIQTDQWLGYGPQKQLALNQASGDWVLSIDADERVSDELREEIISVVRGNLDNSLQFKRENYFLGARMRFGGWSGDWVTRLAKKGHCRFSSDVVHESLLCNHPAKKLKGKLIHISYRCVQDVFEKQIRYAELGAKKLIQSNKESRHPYLKAFWTFTRLYFFQLGFLDGWRGALAATAKSFETFWRYTLARKDQW
jgi:glycosyltransferase involved in cell wall biosynthesis